MSTRWKFQLRSGLIFGSITSVLMMLPELQDATAAAVYLSPKFAIHAIVMIGFGTFILGYLQWCAKQKESAHDDAVNE